MTETYATYEREAPDWHRDDVISYFECECGSERRVSKETECKQCGAWYKHDDGKMIQVASPIGE